LLPSIANIRNETKPDPKLHLFIFLFLFLFLFLFFQNRKILQQNNSCLRIKFAIVGNSAPQQKNKIGGVYLASLDGFRVANIRE
jgi:hypothetical protein